MLPRIFSPHKQSFLRVATDADNTSTFDPSWVFSDASVMTVNWGDGTPKESHATGLSHTYAAGLGRHTVRFNCPDWTKLTRFDVNTDVCRLALPNLDICTSLYVLYIYDNQFNNISPFDKLTNLGYVELYTNQFSGILPVRSSNTALISIAAYYNSFSDYIVGSLATQKNLVTIHFGSMSLTETSVDAILADCVISLAIPARVICTLYLHGGSNAPASAAGIVNKNLLIAAGWTVQTT